MPSEQTLYLYGRSGILRDLQDHLLAAPERPVLVHGPAGIGKSALLDRLTLNLKSCPENVLALQYRVVSQAHSLQHLLGSLVVQLINRTSANDNDLGRFRRALNLLNREYSLSLITAGLLDLASAFAPTLKKTSEALISVVKSGHDASSSQALAETIAKKSSDDLLAGFTQLIAAVSNEWPRGVILLDQVEAGSQVIQDAIIAILKTLPPTWSLTLSINDELPDGIAAMRRFRPPIEYKNGLLVALPRLELDAFEIWTRNARGGTLPPLEMLQDALSRCDGRPLFLQDWIRGFVTSTDANLLNRLGSYYDRRLSALSADARRLLRTLAILPAQAYFSFDFCHTILDHFIPNISTDRTLDLIAELTDNYLLMPTTDSVETYRFVHDVARLHIRKALPASAARASATALLLSLRRAAENDAPQDRYTRVFLADIAGDRQLLQTEGLETGQALIRAGSYEAAYRTFEICGALQDDDADSALVGQAQVLLETGFYIDAVEKLKHIQTSDPRTTTRANLLRGWCYLRLNRYVTARTYLLAALDGFRAQRDIEGASDAERAMNTILRDLGHHREAASHARGLLAQAQTEGASRAALAGCYRVLARSLALTEEITDALDAANTALQIAKDLGSVRSIGNAELCLGEACRHGAQLRAAEGHYRTAMDNAERIANRDSFLWSALGLSDVFVLMEEFEQAAEVLNRVGEIVRDNEARYPLENYHWRFSIAVLDFIRTKGVPSDIERVVADYDALGIHWPATYFAKLLRTPEHLEPKPF